VFIPKRRGYGYLRLDGKAKIGGWEDSGIVGIKQVQG